MKGPSNGFLPNSATEGERKSINSELWHACAGPLVSLPPVGSLVVYFPQGHSEQVAASMQKEADFIPSYPNLPSKLICMLHNVTLHADVETDEVYAQMTLQPVSKYDKEALTTSEIALKINRQPSEFFCKTLTASDKSTHGGFSVPRRAAEKIFPPLDYTLQPPAQELVASDLHNNTWMFRHIYRGQPKRHLLTSGWSVFVSTKRLFAGDSVLFIRDEKQQLLLGIKHANKQQSALASSVISSDSMHIGILAAAAHAAANNSPFTIFFNPRASPSEFVVPFAKYNKAMYTQVSPGMRFRMMFETEESGVRRYMGTITGTSDFDPLRWKNSQWRNLQVGWDESTAGDRPSRVSIWEIEPVVSPFYICPPPFFRPKFPGQPGMPGDESDFGMKDANSSVSPGLSLVQWMNLQQNNQFPGAQSGFFPSGGSPAALHNGNLCTDDPSKLLNFQSPGLSPANLQFNKVNPQNHVGQLTQSPLGWPQQQMQQLLRTTANQQQQQPPPHQQQQQQPPPQQQQPPLPQQAQQRHQLDQQMPPQTQIRPQPQPQTLAKPQSQQQQQLSPHQQQRQQLFQSALVNNGLVSPNQIPTQPQQQQQLYQSAPVNNGLASPNQTLSQHQQQQQQLYQSVSVNNGLTSPNQTLSQHQQQQQRFQSAPVNNGLVSPNQIPTQPQQQQQLYQSAPVNNGLASPNQTLSQHQQQQQQLYQSASVNNSLTSPNQTLSQHQQQQQRFQSAPVNNGLVSPNQIPTQPQQQQQLYQSAPVNNGLASPNQTLSQHQQQQQQLYQSASVNNSLTSPNQTLSQHQQQQQRFQSAPVNNGLVSPNQTLSQHQQQQHLFQSAPVNNGFASPNQIPNQHQPQQQIFQSAPVNNGFASPNRTPNQLQQTSNGTPPPLAGKNSYSLTSLPQQDTKQFQHQIEQQPNSLQRYQQQTQLEQSPLQMLQQSLFQRALQQPQGSQLSMEGVSDQQLQLQLLQKLQQQQQLLSAANSLPQRQTQNQQPLTSDGFSASALMQSQPYTTNQPRSLHKTPNTRKAQSGVTDGDDPSCSTSPASTNNGQVPLSSFVNRNPIMTGNSVADQLASKMVQEINTKNEIRIKPELLPAAKGPGQLRLKSTVTNDQLEASSSGTSYCLEAKNNQPNFSLPPFTLNADVQSNSRSSIPFTANIDGLAPDTLLSRGYDSQKDLQNLLSNYGATPRDIETELSTADISSQSFGLPNMIFKPGSSTDIGFDDTGVLSNKFWANQTQPRMRTYTKVQKRGSVGRSIDVTRYHGYDGLRRDLARMFGIEGQLEDPQNSEWKLVFMDPENDMLLVGDDPWEDFVRCVQSIKILSAVEVQSMSLAGDLGNAPIPNQACSCTDSGNAWRGQYDDNSAASIYNMDSTTSSILQARCAVNIGSMSKTR